VIDVPTARVFVPLLEPSRYKAVYGGRASGKSHFMAEMLVDDHYRLPSLRSVCIREVQKSLKESAKKLIEDKIQSLGLGAHFEVLRDEIRSRGGGSIMFQGMADHTAESIKSLEGMDRAWVEEAQTLSDRSWSMLRPTIRKEGSEIWASWNPTRKTDAIDKFFRESPPANAIVVKANWSDNPFLPSTMTDERLHDLERYPDRYSHVWEGDYVTALEGAYYAKLLAQARTEQRICRLSPDPLLTLRAVWDIGGTGARSDATAIWIVQHVGREIRFVAYYEAVGQPLATHVQWLRSNGYGNALCVLPHDGAQHDKIARTTYEGALQEAGFQTQVVPNQGAGATTQRIEAMRRLFPQMWFDAEKCAGGLDALGWYHEKRDEARGIGLGPEHDWSSHGADAAGLVAISYEAPRQAQKIDYRRVQRHVV
jgi:phage terminase large subunit